MVPGGADEDEDLPLLEEDLIPPLLLGLPQRRSRLDIDAVLGGEGHKRRDVAARGVAVTGGRHVWGSRNILVGELVPRLSTQHDDGTRHVKQALKRIRARSLMLLINFLIRALANPPVLEGLDWYR